MRACTLLVESAVEADAAALEPLLLALVASVELLGRTRVAPPCDERRARETTQQRGRGTARTAGKETQKRHV